MLIFADSEKAFNKLLKELEWIEIQKLSAEHGLLDFCCGTDAEDEELGKFLKEDSLKQQEEHANVTYVVVLKGSKKAIGYVTILNDKLKVSNKEKGDMQIKSRYSEFPAIKIGRLAVDKNYKRKKVGTTMLRYIRGLALTTAEKTGCRFLIVDSYPKSIEWYLKKGFTENLIQNQRTIVIRENANGTPSDEENLERETISLRYDLFNPKK